VEQKKAYPEVTPTFGYTRQYQTKAIGFPDANSWSASVSMSLPVLDRNQGNQAKATSMLAQNGFEYQAALADLRAEIVTLAQEVRAAKVNAEAVAADELKLAREVLESITTAYQAGGRPLVDFLDAQRNFRETYRSYITTRAAYWRAVYRYGAALGQKVTP
jgi:cobalt-zinc-cadmium efflux system outer membrane protein